MQESGNNVRFCKLPGFHLHMIMGDYMHVVLLGILQIACGCAIVELADEGVWGFQEVGSRQLRYSLQLRAAFSAFRQWQRDHGITCSQPCFTLARTHLRCLLSIVAASVQSSAMTRLPCRMPTVPAIVHVACHDSSTQSFSPPLHIAPTRGIM